MKALNREDRIRVAQHTLEILSTGFYTNKQEETVELKDELEYAIKNSALYRPEMFEVIKSEIDRVVSQCQDTEPIIEVTNETTLAAASRLILNENMERVVCLNFASAKNPGGGFLNGSQAQEESLARSSGLYPCIVQMREMYDHNRGLKTCLYSDYMIYSPQVPVFRDDVGDLLNKPYTVSFITAPAVNAGVVNEREPHNRDEIQNVMIERIKRVFSVAIKHEERSIILGAYGCGVFRNNPEDVAHYFKKVLIDEKFYKCFDKIVFAIYDNSANKSNISAFQSILIG